jgi:ACT domain-containing protein
MPTQELAELLKQVKQLLEECKESKRRPSITDFCEEKGISRSLFYKLKLPYAKAGARSITTPATEAAWQRMLSAQLKP